MKKDGCFVAAMFRRIRVALRTGIMVLLAACVLFCAFSAPAPSSAGAFTGAESSPNANSGFDTPEDAVGHFVKALAANDFNMAMEACAVREQADGFDFPGSVERLKMHAPMLNPAPSTSSLYRDLNSAAIMGGLANQIKMMIYSFFVTEGLDGKTVPADKAYGEAFAQAVDAKKLTGLKLLHVDPPVKSILKSEKNIANFNKRAKIYGAQEMTERIALYELDGQTFVGGFGLYRFASGWKIFSLNSILAGQPSFGTVTKMTVQAYLGML